MPLIVPALLLSVDPGGSVPLNKLYVTVSVLVATTVSVKLAVEYTLPKVPAAVDHCGTP